MCLVAGLFAHADGSQVRVRGVWHVWKDFFIARWSLAHLHGGGGLISGRCDGWFLCMTWGLFAYADGSQVRARHDWHAWDVWECAHAATRSLAHLHATKESGWWRAVVFCCHGGGLFCAWRRGCLRMPTAPRCEFGPSGMYESTFASSPAGRWHPCMQNRGRVGGRVVV